MSQLIARTPDVALMIFDLCVIEHKYHNHRTYGEMEVERKMIYLFFPFKRKNGKHASWVCINLFCYDLVLNALDEVHKYKYRLIYSAYQMSGCT